MLGDEEKEGEQYFESYFIKLKEEFPLLHKRGAEVGFLHC